jgi:hypothetical protein
MKKTWLWVFVLLLSAGAAMAQSGAMMGGGMMGRPGAGQGNGAGPFGFPIKVDDVPLTGAQVKAFIAFHQKVQTLTPAEREELKHCKDFATTAASPTCTKVRGWWEASGLKSEDEAKSTSWKVIRAYMHVSRPEEMAQMQENGKMMDARLKDPNTPEMAKQYMRQGQEMIKMMKCPEADVKTVSGYSTEIKAIMDKYEEWGKQGK